MRDKSTGIAIAFAVVAMAFGYALGIAGVFRGPPVASSDVTIQTAAPTVDDDRLRGYLPGSEWIDQANEKTYQAISTGPGAANWTQTNVQ